METQRISDELEIARLLTTYARAVDSKDWELYRSVFTDDAQIDYSSAGAIVGSRDEVVDWFAANFGVIPWSMHYITNIEILESSSGTARVRAMFYNPMQLPGMEQMSPAAATTTTNWYARRTAGAAAACARRTSGSPTPRDHAPTPPPRSTKWRRRLALLRQCVRLGGTGRERGCQASAAN